ncbi:MAG: NADP oxidoreductase [SAR202 cluster bacterium]|nr:NADP oxidoreductase [SAR202 cluster bacterium]
MPSKPKIAIIGDGKVGSALKRGLTRGGYDVRAVGREPKQVAEVAKWGDAVILAMPYAVREAVIAGVRDAVKGKTVVDATNGLDKGLTILTDPRRESGAEQVQQWVPEAKVVKAFNNVFAETMDSGKVNGEAIATFVAGNDDAARKQVVAMAMAIGFDAVEAGSLENARLIEMMGNLTITLAHRVGMGRNFGFKIVRGG